MCACSVHSGQVFHPPLPPLRRSIFVTLRFVRWHNLLNFGSRFSRVGANMVSLREASEWINKHPDTPCELDFSQREVFSFFRFWMCQHHRIPQSLRRHSWQFSRCFEKDFHISFVGRVVGSCGTNGEIMIPGRLLYSDTTAVRGVLCSGDQVQSKHYFLSTIGHIAAEMLNEGCAAVLALLCSWRADEKKINLFQISQTNQSWIDWLLCMERWFGSFINSLETCWILVVF